ncbi:secretion pathway protein Sls2/Rcy1, putative [Talaromyces stipitatus ATCC 10500]|uniref:Secretion pathway protein Sls2/Rcy1, putative n=1 Tax=Talaromyces stipitatus (strain ATCC 10500 / CBS 375.48 / QM 6759 / NRRL 1006) TaxID=441959 RepID=B8MB29_TALSN|nr:secretion pathway protein Sls2/Rcy1, putative [Talaromyces stipitatus ATCC 10500]EED18730.1 secretion pathway protein Sls2/Rcy1, putative [Talaromyces stipitatus ATCC 10500]
MSKPKRPPASRAPPRRDVLASLKMASMEILVPVLPAELMSQVLDYVDPPDLIRVAQTSKRMREMVYEDARWIARLKRMGCWNEEEARQNAEKPMSPTTPATGYGRRSSVYKNPTDGFDTIPVSSGATKETEIPIHEDETLDILRRVKSLRGNARQEYGKVHAVLAPLYNDIAKSGGSTDSLVFRRYTDPESQAKMLAQIVKFANSDTSDGWAHREACLQEAIQLFETAAIREFRNAYEASDVNGEMRKYTHVLWYLNGGQSAVDLFLHHNHIITRKSELGRVQDCIDTETLEVKVEHTQAFFTRFGVAYNKEIEAINGAFPKDLDVALPFLDKASVDVVSPFLTGLFDELHQSNIESYLKAVSGTFAQCFNLFSDLEIPLASGVSKENAIARVMAQIFEPHLDLYLAEELDFFRKGCDATVEDWDRQLSEQAASTESFLMSNVNRQAAKNDFLTSFKKVLMAPVTILPLPSFSSKTQRSAVPETENAASHNKNTARFSTFSPPTPATPLPEAPSDELAAKAALMNSRLEGIKSLFSIEVALGLVHAAKTSLERTVQFVKLGGDWGNTAKLQCEGIFISLLEILGHRHVIKGFTKAVDHLSNYRPREQGERDKNGVEPLVTFLELVNVGDLILQMMDVFYEQELIGAKLIDRSDFLDPAAKGKKKFEQRLDECVASGLNKGIDVLMEEVDYILATKQLTTDYNPEADIDAGKKMPDISVSDAAIGVIDVVSSHTSMLIGSTDKSTLDVFNQEVGLRLFAAICKHLKRQRISVDGSLKLISDMNHYFKFIQNLKNNELLLYFKALRELSQIYLIDPSDAKELAFVIADNDRFYGIFRAEEVYEFAERRADWFQVRRDVERAMYGLECSLM